MFISHQAAITEPVLLSKGCLTWFAWSFQASFSNGIFRIPAARKSDESDYECIATNPSGSDTQRTILYVTGKFVNYFEVFKVI